MANRNQLGEMSMSVLNGRIRGLALVLTSAASLVVSSSSLGHHAFAAEFDADQPIDLRGAVTKIKWVNPHSWLFFDVKDANGNVTNWGVEFGAPNQLARLGLKKTDVAIGTEVHIKGYRSKNGGPFGYSVVVTFADGRSFQTGGAQDAPSRSSSAASAGAQERPPSRSSSAASAGAQERPPARAAALVR
jgi:hypothetical protein